ncbi:MAG: LAGLIDADG family homing endonuclease [Patescibacteria group bacterium]
MGARGPKPLGKVKIEWSPNFAYAIGLITTDGNLSKDGRHINFTSKDKELIQSFKDCLNLKNRIGKKARGGSRDKKYFVIQFGDVLFYQFLLTLGLTPAKSKTLSKLTIPEKFFADFMRGCIDGDGNINIAKHPESRHPQLRIRLFSASEPFLSWIRVEIKKLCAIKGGWIEVDTAHKYCKLSFGKADSVTLIKFIYYNNMEFYLKRKYSIVEDYFGRVAELA